MFKSKPIRILRQHCQFAAKDKLLVSSMLKTVSNILASCKTMVKLYINDNKDGNNETPYAYMSIATSQECGGDLHLVPGLCGVQRLESSSAAFAAILADGSATTWGDPNCGGDCSEVQLKLKNVTALRGNSSAFAAIAGGQLVTWGCPYAGGDCSRVAMAGRQNLGSKDLVEPQAKRRRGQ